MSTEKMHMHSTAVINGDLKFTNVGQILKSRTFGQLMSIFVKELSVRKSRKIKALKPFMKESGTFDSRRFQDFLILLNMKPLSEVLESDYFDIHYSIEEYKELMLDFLEGFYNYWRNIQRFMVKNEQYSSDDATKRSKAHSL
ncbi:MAG: hypothetical protein RR790_04460, partial [Eubacterium sp.]